MTSWRPVGMLIIVMAIVGCSTSPPADTSARASETPAPASVAPGPGASSSGTGTVEPIASPSGSASQTTDVPASAGTDSPTSPAAVGALQWREIGRLGRRGIRHDDHEGIDAFIGFDAGYLAFQRTTGRDGEWATRVWFSADGTAWEAADSFGADISLDPISGSGRLSVATNGSEVLIVARTRSAIPDAYDERGSVWMTSDGLSWIETAGDLLPLNDWYAQTVLATPEGWLAVFSEDYYEEPDCDYSTPMPDCYRQAVWWSPDGASWERLGPLTDGGAGEESASAIADDGTIVASLEQVSDARLLASDDGGRSWRELPTSGSCPVAANWVIAPSVVGAPAWVVAGLLPEGGVGVCSSDETLDSWQAHEIPTASSFYPGSLVQTRYGAVLSVERQCIETTDCPPFLEHFISADGQSWSELPSGPDAVLADGPAGVVALAGTTENGWLSITSWKLEPGGD